MSKDVSTAASGVRRVTRSNTSAAARGGKGTQGKKKEQHQHDMVIKQEEGPPGKKRPLSYPDEETPGRKRLKEEDTSLSNPTTSARKKSQPKKSGSSDLKTKKLKSYAQFANQSPFPNFHRPTVEECKLAHRILASLHGPRIRPKEVVASTTRAGCGDSPNVLDALVRTILSQNTSDVNSTRAKKSMDKVYGGSDKWDAIVAGGEGKLQEAIKCGGLSAVKSKVIVGILKQSYEKYGKYSLDHLHYASSEEAMQEMLSFQGVGPKTASCVLLFCLQRESFAVDTHVWRITGLLGWRPKNATRDETHAHLDVMIPDEDKYGLHILLVTHGKKCEECRAGGKNLGQCELRKAFRQKKMQGEAGEEAQQEEMEKVKKEDED
ncbi:uncharacterized protein A1O5_11958 [Cladophialophora psammophila CBS 110553]|uniref:HhH-GPD domain-containing protein n=1 Tax=Cladophialophora psammophila CBS 110553 TaxID=1182543 RepID=W9W9G2_9EURO|nr:uncharacterized protein A1O5_11958 [Cladophialophora psammophila CBS 110553]EXJ61166.1 hypothetical protein A1O5_11958 [Cladophialophora psammophila CBS 110553]